jgi:hypothetical protein
MPLFLPLQFPFLLPCMFPCCESICDRWTLANTFSSSQSPDACLRASIATPPKFRSLGLHLELLHDPSFKTRIHLYPFSLFVLARVPLQMFLDFNAVYVLIE